MTDKQHDTRKDTQKTAGELQGRTHRRQDGTSHGDGDTTGHTRQPRNTQQAGGAEGREQRGTEDTRQQGGRRDKKEYVIFKGEKREKTPLRLAKACKHCIYISLNIVAWWPFVALSFIY